MMPYRDELEGALARAAEAERHAEAAEKRATAAEAKLAKARRQPLVWRVLTVLTVIIGWWQLQTRPPVK
mgnify:FL=1